MQHVRTLFAALYTALAVALALCAFKSHRSHKRIGIFVERLMVSLIPAVLGNLLVICTSNPLVATVGYYLYFLSIDFIVFASIHFARNYCHVSWPGERMRKIIHILLLFDIVQLLLDPVFNHAFDLEAVIFDGKIYYKAIAYWGLTFHRVMNYAIIAMVMGIFLYKVVTVPKIYLERYSVILALMVLVALWQAFYVFSRTPLDRSMIGYSFYGLLIYYFALYYRPRRLLDSMLADISSDMNEALFFFDASAHCVWANEPGVALARIEDEDYESAKDKLIDIFGSLINDTSEEWSSKQSVGSGDGARYYTLERHTKRDKNGHITASYLRIRDDTDEQRAFEREQYAARHDALTGVYNKSYLYKRIGETVRSGGSYVVIFIDISEFKIVNDIFGNDFGDYALRCVAHSLRKELPEGTLFGRISGDQFGVCMREEDYDENLINDADYLVQKGGNEHRLVLHKGVYMVTDPNIDVSVMFDRAHMALQTIKGDYNRRVAYYTEEMREQTLWSQEISAELSEAIRTRQIVPYLQPITDAEGHTIGAEVLVRWIHPVHGFLPPIRFIPVFEKNGMIAAVDKHMWHCACEILAQWKREGVDKFLSINISPKDFYFMDVAAEISALVAEYGVEPGRLRLEITETVMMSDMENRIRMIDSLRQKGFLMEMDDFGSGYSSLNMLKDMPVDVVKIDMAFLRQAKADNKAMKILRNVIHMTEDLGILSLTEGVETSLQYEALNSMGCKMFQGYYFAKPMPLDEFERFCGISA